MSTIVYWSCFEEEWMRSVEPESVYKKFFKIKPSDKRVSMRSTSSCPAIGSAMKNIFALKSIYTYQFNITNNNVFTEFYDEDFFNKHVLVRDIDNKFFSFSNRMIFFTEEKSLKMTAYLHPFLENNHVSSSTFSIPGEFDIGKWFRPLEFPFYLKDSSNYFKINEGDSYTYIKFHTEEKIVFKKFYPSEKLKKYANDSTSSGLYGTSGLRSLYDFYKMFSYKDKIIKEIKNNLI